MFRVPTVLILGAGASMPYHFPSGRELLFRIKSELRTAIHHVEIKANPDQLPQIYKVMKWFKFPHQSIEFFTNALNETMQPSIDAFLERYSEYIDMGKVAIAASLIPFENRSVITQRELDDMKWYEYFFNLIRDPEEIKRGNLSVVTFNYDRSLEYFLYHAFMNSYHLDPAQTIDLMKHITILHIYGSLGAPKFLDKAGRNYEQTVDIENIKKCVEAIKIMPEVEDSHTTLEEVQYTIHAAERIIFIGFSFHSLNVKRLKLNAAQSGNVFGTVCNMMDGEISRVRATLREYEIHDAHLHEKDALNFLRATNYFA